MFHHQSELKRPSRALNVLFFFFFLFLRISMCSHVTTLTLSIFPTQFSPWRWLWLYWRWSSDSLMVSYCGCTHLNLYTWCYFGLDWLFIGCLCLEYFNALILRCQAQATTISIVCHSFWSDCLWRIFLPLLQRVYLNKWIKRCYKWDTRFFLND